jgi:hypothetical protein
MILSCSCICQPSLITKVVDISSDNKTSVLLPLRDAPNVQWSSRTHCERRLDPCIAELNKRNDTNRIETVSARVCHRPLQSCVHGHHLSAELRGRLTNSDSARTIHHFPAYCRLQIAEEQRWISLSSATSGRCAKTWSAPVASNLVDILLFVAFQVIRAASRSTHFANPR